jgi:5'' nucleotidase, deoxy (Pyrimidine), cytosolic type C protein (NT5C).
MRIGVDLDGVVANFTKGWTEQYKIELAKKYLNQTLLIGDYLNL